MKKETVKKLNELQDKENLSHDEITTDIADKLYQYDKESENGKENKSKQKK